MPVSARREAVIGISVDPSKMDAGVDGARRKMRKMRKDVEDDEEEGAKKKKKKKAFDGGLPDFAKGLASNLGGRAIHGVVDALQESASSAFDVEKSLVRLQIVGNMSGTQLDSFRDKLRRVSDETGLTKQSILEGTGAYIDLTGDVAGATKGMSQFARIAQASDASMADVTGAAASMMDAMHVKPEDFEAVFSGLINQGKAGAVTLKNMAGEFPELLTRFARFSELGNNGTLELGAMFQVVRKGFGSAAEAGTGLKGLMDGLKKHADRFGKGGVQVFDVGKDGTKTFKPLSQILTQLEASKLMKDPQALSKAFGKGEGEQAYNMLVTHLDMLRQMEEAGQDASTVTRDLATYSTSAAGRIDIAWNNVKNTLAAVFTPDRVAAFASALEGLAGVLGTVVDRLGALFAKWQEIRDATKDPNEWATDAAEETVGKGSKVQESAARQNEQIASGMSGASSIAHFVEDDDSSGWLGSVLKDALLPGHGAIKAAENDRYIKTAQKQHRQATASQGREYGAARDARDMAENRAAAIAGAGGFDYNAMGTAVAKALAEHPIQVKVDGKVVATAASNATPHLKQKSH